MVARKPRASSLLFNEPPLIVIPSLAVLVGLHEAIFLQQLHYWLQGTSGKERDGRKWVYNTRKEWQDQFPFWSVDAIKRAAESLKKQGIILTSADHNKSKMDRTLWYSIDYDLLYELAESPNGQADTPNGMAGVPIDLVISPNADGEYAHSNQETTHETTTKITQERGKPPVARATSPTGGAPSQIDRIIRETMTWDEMRAKHKKGRRDG
jgi:hypothetical protein